jgi:hypothetical protein
LRICRHDANQLARCRTRRDEHLQERCDDRSPVAPHKALEETTHEDRQLVADVIGTMTSWPWVGASLATKTLHKKRPALIPILDNQAILGAYMNAPWPEKRSLMDTIKAVPAVKL